MPRTKVNRKVLANKRARRSSTEERIEQKQNEFDRIVAESQAEDEEDYRIVVEQISDMVNAIRQKTPSSILGMTLGELRKSAGKTLCEVTMSASHQPSGEVSDLSTLGSLSIVGDKIGGKKRTGQDEGYLTEASTRSSGRSSNTSSISGRPLGPLASSKAMRNRRSRSAGPNSTAKVLPASSIARATPLKQTMSSHLPRSKYRTPMDQQRQKASSVDRLLITPKVQPNTPMAVLRRANVGETVYSVTGSPVITGFVTEETANVNIPIANGVLSIRPTEMSSVDPGILTKIDMKTISNLKQLQSNLNMLMKAAGF